ncbi:MAG: thiamine-monophosphate kinase [Candidatus Eisenbacteria bacterium]|nr:thiamine-monophosphate kinase [Candidatus Eisenbacteria bacterium]
MKPMDEITENAAIDVWVRAFARSPRQLNAPHESDAEIVEMPGMPGQCLAITIDTVAEEVRAGLYRDPYTTGWVAAMASLSDLAAVGADPLGLVISASVPPGTPRGDVERTARGMEEACRSLGVFVLGGDLNSAEALSVGGCAVGLVPRDGLLTRRGVLPGDAIVLTGPAGAGNALGLARFAGLPDDAFPEGAYRPVARLRAGRALRGRAHACMDTSDGVLATLDQLMRLNGCGFEVVCDWPRVLAPGVGALCDRASAPPWMMLAGAHGEFELVCAVPEGDAESVVADLTALGHSPVRLGSAQQRSALTLSLPGGRRADIAMAPVRNLIETLRGDSARYLSELERLGRSWGLE